MSAAVFLYPSDGRTLSAASRESSATAPVACPPEPTSRANRLDHFNPEAASGAQLLRDLVAHAVDSRRSRHASGVAPAMRTRAIMFSAAMPAPMSRTPPATRSSASRMSSTPETSASTRWKTAPATIRSSSVSDPRPRPSPASTDFGPSSLMSRPCGIPGITMVRRALDDAALVNVA